MVNNTNIEAMVACFDLDNVIQNVSVFVCRFNVTQTPRANFALVLLPA